MSSVTRFDPDLAGMLAFEGGSTGDKMDATEAVHRKAQRKMRAAEGYLALQMPNQALRELKSLAEPLEDRYPWHCLKAEAHRGLEEWAEALEEFQSADTLRNGQLDVLMGMAWCFKRLGRLPQSITAMQDAYAAHPKVPVVLYNLACYYSLSGQKTQAVAWLARALRMDPDLRQLVAAETDFDPVRDDAAFLKLMALSGSDVPSAE